MRHVCPVCGVVYHGGSDRLYCSAKCQRRATGSSTIEKKKPRLRRALCLYCETEFMAEPGQVFCCESCRHLAELTTPMRHCHDCGKICLGYRCDACNRRLSEIYDE